MRFRKRLFAVFLAALAVTQLSACADKPAPQESSIPYANVWSADPGIDLFSREAELVRAAHESGWLVYNAGTNYAYSGYPEAVSELAGREPTGDLERDSASGYLFTHGKGTQSGDWLKDANETDYSHITALTAAGNSVTATVCRYVVPTGGVSSSAERSEFARDMSVIEIRLENSSNDPGLPGVADRAPDQHDPAARRPPTWNVFGRWNVTSIRREFNTDPPGCRTWFQQRLPWLKNEPGSPTLQFPDSFTVPAQPVAIQYPEWIGSST
ncbi:hypothetical protein AB4305_14795 [Nocardia sp. 2YAB30]|uniref:hypothetical protein n=1 Tax=unclassified Nocardia TaxID=2637762 RepID=UPI003F985D24